MLLAYDRGVRRTRPSSLGRAPSESVRWLDPDNHGRTWQNDFIVSHTPRAQWEDKVTENGDAILWRILVSESAHLMWRLRCERVIGHSEDAEWQHPREEIAARWLSAINARVRQDIVGTSYRYGKLALKKVSVVKTWKGITTAGRGLPAASRLEYVGTGFFSGY